ncbi:hypothetical protein OG21DRAFT_99276 [Imleria badia]|nr:hypothetical protein OG21DRAFT_99276 [Imleria badia]
MFGVSLNPGPFNIKEHVLVTIMSTVSAGVPAYVVCSGCVHDCHINVSYPFRQTSLLLNGYTTTRRILLATQRAQPPSREKRTCCVLPPLQALRSASYCHRLCDDALLVESSRQGIPEGFGGVHPYDSGPQVGTGPCVLSVVGPALRRREVEASSGERM